MAMSSYPGGFSDGVLIRGMPITQTHTGKVFWVSNASAAELPGQRTASNGNNGSFSAPYSTLDYAIDQCLSGRGDVIMVKPGYTQTITLATEILFDKAGIAIVGLGAGTLRPTITYGTNATANIPISAANMSIQNFLFVSNVANVTSLMTVSGTALATDFTVEHCEFRDTSATSDTITILTDNATAQSLQGLYFANNRIQWLGTTAATTAITLTNAAHSRVQIVDNWFVMAALDNTACVVALGSNVMLQLEIARNIIYRPSTDTATGGMILTGTGAAQTGLVYDNYIKSLDVAGMIVADVSTALGFINNLMSGTADTSGIVIPAIDS
jgi:hypothetical protein